jgi:hypothetical protein
MKIFVLDICKFDFFDTALADMLRVVDGGSALGSTVLSFCCIGYMGMTIGPDNRASNLI